MPVSLSDLVAAGRDDLVPGRVLSPLDLIAHGKLEQRFAAMYLETVGLGLAHVDSDVRAAALREALNDVRAQRFAFGTPLYHLAQLSDAGIFEMFLASLQVAKPETSRAEAMGFFRACDVEKVREQLLRWEKLIDDAPKGAGDAKPTPSATPVPSDPPASIGTKSTPPASNAAAPSLQPSLAA